MPKNVRKVSQGEGHAVTPAGMTARQRARASQQRRKNLTWMLILGGALLLGAAIVLPMLQPVDPTVLNDAPLRVHPEANGNSLGSPEAQVVLEEFADFQCSACASFWEQIEPILIENYVATGKIRLVYRTANNFLGPDSASAGEALYCAEEQGQFWEMKDLLYANFSSGNVGGFSEKRVSAMAAKLGLDVSDFDACMSSNRMVPRLEQDLADFEAVNADLIAAGQSYGTPTLAINGVRVDLVSSWDELFAALDAAVAGP